MIVNCLTKAKSVPVKKATWEEKVKSVKSKRDKKREKAIKRGDLL